MSLPTEAGRGAGIRRFLAENGYVNIPGPFLFVSFVKSCNIFVYLKVFFSNKLDLMERHALKNVNNCLNTNIYSYLETSRGQSSNLYLNVVHFFNNSVNSTSLAA